MVHVCRLSLYSYSGYFRLAVRGMNPGTEDYKLEDRKIAYNLASVRRYIVSSNCDCLTNFVTEFSRVIQ